MELCKIGIARFKYWNNLLAHHCRITFFFNHCRAPQALSACAAVLVPPCAMHRVLLQQRRRSGAAAAGRLAAPTRRTGAVRSEALSTPPRFGAAPPPVPQWAVALSSM